MCSPFNLTYSDGAIKAAERGKITCATTKYSNSHELKLSDSLEVLGVQPLKAKDIMLYEKGKTVQTLVGGSKEFFVRHSSDVEAYLKQGQLVVEARSIGNWAVGVVDKLVLGEYEVEL